MQALSWFDVQQQDLDLGTSPEVWSGLEAI